MNYISIDAVLSLITVVALMLVFFYVLNKYKSRFLFQQGTDLSIESQLSLGYRQRLMLVNVKGKTLLLAVSHDSTTVLTTWPDSQKSS